MSTPGIYIAYTYRLRIVLFRASKMGNASSLRHHIETAEKTGVIQLSKSNLRDLPKDLIQISQQIRTLDLNTNRIQRLNESISCFKNLKILNLNHNKLKLISGSIGYLDKLETFLLENNLLETLPNEIGRLSNLKTLNLSGNSFRSFPIQVCSLKNLEMLDLSNNVIESIPDEVGNSQVSELNLNNNKLRKLNDSLIKCPKLKILRLDNNQLELSAITRPILADSKICLLSVENNPFTLKQLQERDGYEQYSERYTSTKRKMI